MAKLTPKQLAFIREYQVDHNGTQAAIRAGYSENGASVQATRLLANARVRSEINQRRDKREKRCEISVDALMEKLYSAATDCLSERDPAMLNAGINAANRLAKMQGWDAPDKRENRQLGEFEAMTNEERRAKIVELNERIKCQPPKTT